MKKIFLLVLWALFPSLALANCEQFVVPYATASTISVCLRTYDSAAVNDNEKLTFKNNATFAAGDIKINIDHAGEANIGTLPTDRGTCYDFPISIGESTGKEGYITIIDQTSPAIWVPTCVEYRTAGDPSAFYPAPDVNVAEWDGTAIAGVDTAGYPKVTIKDGTGTGEVDTSSGSVLVNLDNATGTLGAAQLETDTITAAKIAAAAITSSEFTATPTIGGINSSALADLFDTNSGTTYLASVAGSVVKEIVDNASGGSNVTITTGTAQSVSAGPPAKMVLAASANYATNALNDNSAVMILSSSGNTAAVGQVLCIKSNVNGTDEVTFNRAYKSLPSGTITYAIIPAPNCNTLTWPQSH